MKTGLKLSLVGALLVAAGFAYSQGPMGADCDGGPGQQAGMQGMQGMQGMRQDRMGKMDPTRMQARVDQRNATLKAELKITAAQEAAWTAYTEAMKPGAAKAEHQRPDPAELAKLTTPERLDKMQALRAQHMGEMSVAMDKHVQATKALYAELSPEQQKVFDAATLPGQRHARGERKGPRGG